MSVTFSEYCTVVVAAAKTQTRLLIEQPSSTFTSSSQLFGLKK